MKVGITSWFIKAKITCNNYIFPWDLWEYNFCTFLKLNFTAISFVISIMANDITLTGKRALFFWGNEGMDFKLALLRN